MKGSSQRMEQIGADDPSKTLKDFLIPSSQKFATIFDHT